MLTLPDFNQLARVFAGAGIAHSPSELHGVICGLLATGHGVDDAPLLGILAAHAELPQGFPDALTAELIDCRDSAHEGFSDTGLELALLLPDDDEDLGLRVAALGQWSEGFLIGFGTGAAGMSDSQLSPGVQEALSDLAAVSQIDTPEEHGEEEESLLEQVTEHCRMAALMIYTDLVMKPIDDPAPPPPGDAPTRH
jgi:uncharacterized protein YgfB (UPF0149 family)